MLEINVKAENHLGGAGQKLSRSMLKAMRQATQYLIAEIRQKRLSKPRTGPWRRRRVVRWKKASGRSGGMAGTAGWQKKARRESGPPQYPAVLSVVTGQLRRGIVGDVRRDGDRIIGRVGTNVRHGIIWEMRHRRSAATWNRQWLRPALRDNVDEIAKIVSGELVNWAKLLGVSKQGRRAEVFSKLGRNYS